jgi:hypothetical protein
VRLEEASPPVAPGDTVVLPLTTPLTFGDLGGDGRRDRGVGVEGGEEEPDLTPLSKTHMRRYLQVSLYDATGSGVVDVRLVCQGKRSIGSIYLVSSCPSKYRLLHLYGHGNHNSCPLSDHRAEVRLSQL